MERVYRYILVGIMVVLIIWGLWYVFSCFRGQGAHEDGMLVQAIATETVKKENGDGTGNGIY